MHDKDCILSVLPHRDPFMFLDGAEITGEGEVTAHFTFTPDMPFFKGHFPSRPIVPGVLIIEALCQAGAFGLLSRPENKDMNALLTGVTNARFRAAVNPGDKLIMKVKQTAFKMNVAQCDAEAYVGDTLAAKCRISCALVPV